MARKRNDTRDARPDTCAKCKRGSPVPVAEGNPKVVQCGFFNRRFVANSVRNCDHAI